MKNPLKNNLKDLEANVSNLAKNHYENFPVASLVLPRKFRFPVSLIYRFAREADDFADEGEAPPPHY